MSNKGYQLVDGTWSTEYQVGDKFEVDSIYTAFDVGETITLIKDDKSECPQFEGEHRTAFEFWSNLKAVNPKPKSFTTFTKKDLKDGMWVTQRKGKGRILIGSSFYEFKKWGFDCEFLYMELISDYNELLSHKTTSSLDIMKVEYMGEVLWEREEQTEEQKRIKELEECIAKAQEELNKIGVKQ